MKRVLLASIFLLGISLSISARTRVYGWAEKGNQEIKTSPTTTYKTQTSFPGCTITVYLTGTVTIASIYSNNSGTVKANPFTSDANAFWFFYADDGRYDVKFSGTGITTPFTVGDFTIFDNTVSFAGVDTRGLIELDTIPVLSTKPIAVGVNSEKVINVPRVYNPEFYGGVAGAANSKVAIRAAISAAAAVGGGIVQLPVGIWNTDDTLTIPTNVTIQGTGYRDSGLAPSILRLTVSSKPLLLIAGSFRYVSVKNIELRCSSMTSTTAIEHIGDGIGSSLGLDIDRIAIDGCSSGLNVDGFSSGGNPVQLEQLTLNKVEMTGVNIGVRINSINTSVSIDNTHITGVAGSTMLQFASVGPFTVSNSFGGNDGVIPSPYCSSPDHPDDSVLATAFIRFQSVHGPGSIINSGTEGVAAFLINDMPDYNNPITLIGNLLQAQIVINEPMTLNMQGNQMQVQQLVVINTADARIITHNDNTSAGTLTNVCGVVSTQIMFSYQVAATATAAVPIIESNGYRFNILKYPLKVFSPAGFNGNAAFNPIVSIGTSEVDKVLLALGESDGNETLTNKYNIARDSRGFLTFTGSQALGNRGYSFNGPVELFGSSSSLTAPAGKAIINYNATNGFLQGSANAGSLFNFIGSDVSITNGCVPYFISGAAPVPKLQCSSLVFAGGNYIFASGDITVATGVLSMPFGGIQIGAGNLGITTGSIATNDGSINTANGDIYSISGKMYTSNFITFPNGDTTPSVALGNNFETNNGAATVITMLDDATVGITIRILCGDANTTFTDGGNLKLSGNFVCTADDVLVVWFTGTNWYEVSRSVN